MVEQAAAPSKRPAQRRLAREVVELIHGLQEANAVESQAEMLFRPSTPSISKPTDPQNTAEETDQTLDNPDVSPSLNRYAAQTNSTNTPSIHVTLPRSLVYNRPIARILYSAGLVSSRSEGHRLASSQGAYIGSRPGGGGAMPDQVDFVSIKNWFPEAIQNFIIDGNLLILRVGKWKVKVVKIVSDEEFEKMGGTAPGWEDREEEQRLQALKEKVEQEAEAETERVEGTEDEQIGKKKVKKVVDDRPNWKKKIEEKIKKKVKQEKEAQLEKMKRDEDEDWKGVGVGIGKRFKVQKMKLRKYLDPMRVRYHLSDEDK